MIIRCLAVLAALVAGGCQSSASSEGAAKAGRVALDYAVKRDLVYTPAGWPKALQADVYVPGGRGRFPGSC